MNPALVGVCAATGVAVGPALDLCVTRVPAKVPVLRPGARDELRPGRAAVLGAANGALFAAMAVRFDGSWALPAFLVLAAALLTLSVIDFEHFLLPNRLVYPTGMAVAVLLALAAIGDSEGGSLLRAVIGAAGGFAAMFVLHLLSPRSLGFGDVRLSFVLGLALGWVGGGEVVLGLFLGFLYGALIGVVLIATRTRRRTDHVPFGPFLAAGALTAILWGDTILSWS